MDDEEGLLPPFDDKYTLQRSPQRVGKELPTIDRQGLGVEDPEEGLSSETGFSIKEAVGSINGHCGAKYLAPASPQCTQYQGHEHYLGPHNQRVNASRLVEME